jgi:hypothetical protein
MTALLFVRSRASEDLDRFAKDVGEILCVTNLERRESSNYRDHGYARTEAFGVTMKISRGGDEGFDKYDFVMALSAESAWLPNHSFLTGLADLVARVLAQSGYDVVRPVGPAIEDRVMHYRRNEQPDAARRERVVTNESKSQ